MDVDGVTTSRSGPSPLANGAVLRVRELTHLGHICADIDDLAARTSHARTCTPPAEIVIQVIHDLQSSLESHWSSPLLPSRHFGTVELSYFHHRPPVSLPLSRSRRNRAQQPWIQYLQIGCGLHRSLQPWPLSPPLPGIQPQHTPPHVTSPPHYANSAVSVGVVSPGHAMATYRFGQCSATST